MEEEADVGPAVVVVVVVAAGIAAATTNRTHGALLEDDGDRLRGGGRAVRAVRDGLVVPLERGGGVRVAERDGVGRDGERDLDEGAAAVEEDGARRRGAEPQREAAVLGRAGVRDGRERGAQRGTEHKGVQGAGHAALGCSRLLFFLLVLAMGLALGALCLRVGGCAQ